MIKAIIFDLGGIVYVTDWGGLNKKFRDKFGFDIRLLKNKDVAEIFRNANIGKSSIKDVAIYLGHKDKLNEIIEHYKNSYFSSKILNKEMLNLIKSLKKKYKIFTITDTNKEHYEADKEGGLFNDFEKVFASYQLGRKKDDISVFRDVLKEIGFKPEEVLFIDDLLPNIENARSIGLNTIHYTDFPKMDKFNEELKNILNE